MTAGSQDAVSNRSRSGCWRSIAIVATLDTKGEEATLIRDYVAARGHRPLLVDTGVLGQPSITGDGLPLSEICHAL